MDDKLVFTLIGIFMMTVGLSQQHRGFVEWYIRWSNSIKGTKTQITQNAVSSRKIVGIGLIILGVGTLIIAFL